MFVEDDAVLENETENEQVNIFSVSDCDASKRIDVFVGEKLSLSRSAAARLIDEGKVTVNGKTVAKNYKLSVSDIVSVELPEVQPSEVSP